MNSVLIPTYCPTPDVADKLARCVALLYDTAAEPFELVVVEQGYPYFRLSGFYTDLDDVSYAHLPKPAGFARAVNIGMKVATGDRIFAINNDIEITTKNWDVYMNDTYRQGLLSMYDGTPCAPSVQVDTSWWSAVLISRATWEEVGELDDKLLNYRFHDQDWSIRCRKKGLQVARYTGVHVKHDESSTYRHMKANVDESAEEKVMRERHGFIHFADWVQHNRASLV